MQRFDSSNTNSGFIAAEKQQNKVSKTEFGNVNGNVDGNEMENSETLVISNAVSSGAVVVVATTPASSHGHGHGSHLNNGSNGNLCGACTGIGINSNSGTGTGTLRVSSNSGTSIGLYNSDSVTNLLLDTVVESSLFRLSSGAAPLNLSPGSTKDLEQGVQSLSIDTAVSQSQHPSLGHRIKSSTSATPYSTGFSTSPASTQKLAHLQFLSIKTDKVSPGQGSGMLGNNTNTNTNTTMGNLAKLGFIKTCQFLKPSVASSSTAKTPPNTAFDQVTNIIRSKRHSISFFINLLSPDTENLKVTTLWYAGNENDSPNTSTPRSPIKREHKSPIKEIAENNDADVPNIEKEEGNSPVKGQFSVPTTLAVPFENKVDANQETSNRVISFPRIRSHTLRPPSKELQENLDARLSDAALRRQKVLNERKAALLTASHAIKIKLLIHNSRMRLDNLRLQAKQEYAASNAQLNRQIHIRQVREKFGAKVERAKRVMLMQKMKKFVGLRRALSEGFAELLKLHNDLEEEEEKKSRDLEKDGKQLQFFHRDIIETLGLNVLLDQELEKEAESEFQASSSKSEQPSEKALEFHKEFSSDYVFSLSPQMEKTANREPLAEKIRRTKSLPDMVLKDVEYDSTIQELLSLLPPVTRFTLRELEMDEILANMQLRHDILFDPDLQFKASDAEDPEAMEKTIAYWAELSDEVEKNGELYRICLLLAEVRAILIELVPNGLEIKDEIYSHIDINLISQQIAHGIMNPTALIDYVAGIMKINCAPIRDVIVDRMVTECKEGKIIKCLETCFEILELMKLDYANHQLSRLRPYIVEHSVTYEWKYFKNQLESHLIKIDNTKSWLKRNWDSYKEKRESQASGPLSPDTAYDLFPDAFLEIISQAAKFSSSSILPETLTMDLARIISFFNSWQDVTILSTILVVFKQACQNKCTAFELESAKNDLWILLNDSDSTMQHISIQMASLAGKIRNRSFSTTETSELNKMTEKMLAPGSKLYELIQSRVGTHLRAGIAGEKLNSELLSKHGLHPVEKEIQELIVKIIPVSELNRAVFGKLYSALLDEIKEGKEVRESHVLRLSKDLSDLLEK